MIIDTDYWRINDRRMSGELRLGADPQHFMFGFGLFIGLRWSIGRLNADLRGRYHRDEDEMRNITEEREELYVLREDGDEGAKSSQHHRKIKCYHYCRNILTDDFRLVR